MDRPYNNIRQVPDPTVVNKQQGPHRQEVHSPQQIPGREAFLERRDVPTQQHMPTTQAYSTGWSHTRQGFIRQRKSFFRRILSAFSSQLG